MRQIKPESGIGKQTMKSLNMIVLDLCKKLCHEVAGIKNKEGSETSLMQAKDIQTAIKLCVPGEIQKHTVSSSARAVAEYLNSRDKKEWSLKIESC